MSRRNLILLILILVIVTGVIFFFMTGWRTPSNPSDPEGGNSFFSNWNFFGGNNNPGENNEPGEVPNNPEVNEPENTGDRRLLRVSSMPVAGYGIFQKERIKKPAEGSALLEGTTNTPPKVETEFVSAVRYVERTSGIIHQTFADKILESKFSSTVIPKVYEAYFGNKGESVVMRYLKPNGQTIQTFVGILPKEFIDEEVKTDHEIKGTFLPDNISDMSISSDSLKMFYIFPTSGGVSGTTMEFTNNKKVQVLDSAFTEWLSAYPTNSSIVLTTKPASAVLGHTYNLNTANRNLTRILADINGLTTLASPSGKSLLYANNSMTLAIYRIDSKETQSINLNTLPEKCVWNKEETHIYCAVPKVVSIGLYPDTWYQGGLSFDDQLWRIEVETGLTTLILNPTAEIGGGEMDMIRLGLDESGKFLFFMNKKDSFLWEFKLD